MESYLKSAFRKIISKSFFTKAKSLKLPPGTYAVFGSGALGTRGIRKSKDIDLIVIPEVYNRLKKDGWKEEVFPTGKRHLVNGVFDIWADLNFSEGYNPDISQVIAEAEVINGVPFIKLEETVKWKKAFGREKDKKDIELINQYLATQKKFVFK